MHFVWESRLVGDSMLAADDGCRICVVDPGRHNFDGGPDFFNARVMIDDRLWAGDVEIHVRASDWYRHGHDRDRSYGGVILHVVAIADAEARCYDGRVVRQVVMCCNSDFRRDYNSLMSTSGSVLRCGGFLPSIGSLDVVSWMGRMGMERLEDKCELVMELLNRFHGDWQETAYVLTARALGFGLNGEPMMRLAGAAPLGMLLKHGDSVEAVEALLLGQAGFLTGADVTRPYTALLDREYRFYRSKFNLRPMENGGWKRSRVRPGGSPERRVAVLASMVAGGFNIVGEIVDAGCDVEALERIFDVELSAYWQGHYSLDDDAEVKVPGLGYESVKSLIINVAVPLLVGRGRTHNEPELEERAVSILESLPAENNRVVRMYRGAGLSCPDAFTSQAMLRLNSAYCGRGNCIGCGLGRSILSRSARIPM